MIMLQRLCADHFFKDHGLKSNPFSVLVANDIDVFIRWFLTGMTRSFLSQMQNGLNFDIQLFEVKSIFLKRHWCTVGKTGSGVVHLAKYEVKLCTYQKTCILIHKLWPVITADVRSQYLLGRRTIHQLGTLCLRYALQTKASRPNLATY